ncbi:hypothetical protein C817_01799 [Dorea sp. 5-2]|nr:hypothetical protein C817_01799 [Dorea sp. 5-2]
MPNYRYHTSDYMRRSGCSRPAPTPQPSMPCPEPVSQPVCCSNTGEYDELNGMPLAMAYVPWQEWQNIYEAEKGFHCGTIFEELNKPFNGITMGGCCK